jgi:hypothetical protein
MGRYLALGSKAVSESDLFDKSLETFTSYPPTPYMPSSPGHISPELDISIMSGDSSDKQLSPKLTKSSSSKIKSREMSNRAISRKSTSMKSESYNSSEELKAYLEEYERRLSSSISVAIDEEIMPRCQTPLPPPLNSDEDLLENNERVVYDENDCIANIPSKIMPPASVEIAPIPRRPSTPMTFYDCQNELRIKMTDDDRASVGAILQADHSSSANSNKPTITDVSHFVKENNLTDDREVLPILLRPPKYPIEYGAYPGVSLSSSEESDEQDVAGYQKRRIRRDMTPQKAAIIASRFLSAMKGRAPLKRQHSVHTEDISAPPTDPNEDRDADASLDYDYDTE